MVREAGGTWVSQGSQIWVSLDSVREGKNLEGVQVYSHERSADQGRQEREDASAAHCRPHSKRQPACE